MGRIRHVIKYAALAGTNERAVPMLAPPSKVQFIMECGYLGGAVIFTFVLALALAGYGIGIGNLIMPVCAALGFFLILGIYVAVC